MVPTYHMGPQGIVRCARTSACQGSNGKTWDSPGAHLQRADQVLQPVHERLAAARYDGQAGHVVRRRWVHERLVRYEMRRGGEGPHLDQPAAGGAGNERGVRVQRDRLVACSASGMGGCQVWVFRCHGGIACSSLGILRPSISWPSCISGVGRLPRSPVASSYQCGSRGSRVPPPSISCAFRPCSRACPRAAHVRHSHHFVVPGTAFDDSVVRYTFFAATVLARTLCQPIRLDSRPHQYHPCPQRIRYTCLPLI